MRASIRKADILIEAIPYIQAFRGKVIVAKYGGSAIDDPAAMRRILQDLIFLTEVGVRSVLVHGGGPAITKRLAASGAESRFVDGLRVTDARAVRLVNRALAEVNRRLVRQVRSLGGRAVGLTPRQKVVAAEPHPRAGELGAVGTVAWVQNGLIRRVLAGHAIPVISPVGVGHGRLYNVNADDVASEVAAALRAEKLVLLTNVRGICRTPGEPSSLIPHVSVKDAKALARRGVVQSGMIPKVRACVRALRRGVKKTHIIDAAIPHALLLEIFTKRGIGTEIVR
ncbi:MAG: acetylglutamate kinase [Candidatus Omnitrophica bacterium]|nr:acetylglutamate kinase [Candidatus Omnitrophota bacterium]